MPFLLSRKPSSKHDNYTFRGTLQGHVGAVVCLGATEDGKLLASGGTDGTQIWDLETMQRIRSPVSPGPRGATTSVAWIKRDDEPGDVLFWGTQNGYVVCWRQGQGGRDFEEVSCRRLTDPAEITGLAFDPVSNRVAICHRKGVVQVYALDSAMKLHLIYSICISDCAAKAIAFGETFGNERDVLVFGMYDGAIYSLRGPLGAVAEVWDIGGLIGDAVVDSRKGSICIDDPSSGVNVHRLDDRRKVKSFSIPATKQMRARKVCFSDQCRDVVCGSDHGVVYVFNRRSGEVVDELRVDGTEWVQTVTSTECNGVPTILAAKSRDVSSTFNEIFVWRKNTEKARAAAGISLSMMTIVHACMLLATVAFLYQNTILGEWVVEQLGRN
ncbi:WD40-repeat-containing domain protein [Mycena sp. CBHHK59/15]|nr:WD40-repeat-containing domain protein [Mycena sp. CBHHK59/15]KAJ6602952.1 WD40-repeat-containing domain protein [Mycena sp. CBHHK59/15]